MAKVLLDLLQSPFSKHTATAPEEHKSEFPRHLDPTDRTDVRSIALANGAICVVGRYVGWVLDEVQIFYVLQ